MTVFQVVILAIVQGITEFLPISSSGHLVVFQKLFGLQPPVFFDILVHVGTLGATLFFFKRELAFIFKGLFRKRLDSWRTVWLIGLGSLPAAIFGYFLQKHLEQIFGSLTLVGWSFLLTAGFLLSTRALERWSKLSDQQKNLVQLNWQDSLIIGAFQAVAILPGVSRSGSTIVSGLWRGLKQETAFRFSFFLAIPAVFGALLLQILDLAQVPANFLGQAVLGITIAGFTGFLALKILERFLAKGKLWVLGVYCGLLGLFCLILPLK